MESLIIKFAASFLIWFMYAGLVALWFLDGKIKKEQVLHALVSGLIAFLIAEILKEVFHTVRPFMVDRAQVLTLTIPKDGAFPSSHTALAFSLAVTIWLHDRKTGWLFIALAFLVGLARILANVHYPIDIFGGALLGIFISFVTDRLHFHDIIKKIKIRG